MSCTKRVLLTGMSGTGKSAFVGELAEVPELRMVEPLSRRGVGLEVVVNRTLQNV